MTEKRDWHWPGCACGEVWRNTEANGHCSQCHKTFKGLSPFDAHHSHVDGKVICADPATAVKEDGTPRFESSQGKGKFDSDTTYWRSYTSPAEKDRLAKMWAALK